MKALKKLLSVALISAFLAGCGSFPTSDVANITGAELDLAEAQMIVLNHLYVKEWNGGGTRPFFSVYIQDDLTKDYMVCAGPNEGLDVASEAGVYYGNLDVPMRRVNGATGYNAPLLNIIIVADQENSCPEPIADDDEIVGTVQVNMEGLLDAPIGIGDGAAYVSLKGRGHDDIEIPDMGPSDIDALTVGELYFSDSVSGDIIPSYYLTLHISNGSSLIFYEIVDPSQMPEMRQPGLIYSWLNLAFDNTDGLSSDQTLLRTSARVELLRDDGVLVGKTDTAYIRDLVGRKVEFSEGSGYIKFRETY